MKIPLSEFELQIDETILKRGLSYFKNGFVTEFTEISNGTFEAIVLGTEDYTVHLEIKNNIIEEHNCNCPYDWGPVCKHIVAVIFYMQRDIVNIQRVKASKPKTKRTKTVTQQVKDLLKIIPPLELKGFIEENCKKDKRFRNVFLTTFGHLDKDQSKEFYKKQIHSILKTAAGRDGWIGWHDMKYVVDSVQPIIKNAEKYLVNENFENVFYISTAFLEEMNDAFDYCDDSNGELGFFIDSSMELLMSITHKNLSKSLRKELFDYCISHFKKGLFTGWGWHLQMLDIASKLAENMNETDTVLSLLDHVTDQYEQEQAQFFKLELLRKFKDGHTVEKFVEEHIGNSSIRNEEISKAFETQNYKRAIELSVDGIEYDKKDKPGLVKNWYNWLLKIAQIQKDIPKIIEYARYLWIDNFHPEQDYYEILRNHIKTEKWNDFLEDLIRELSTSKDWRGIELIRKIYLNEKWWDRLFKIVQKNPSLHNIQENEKYLANDYSKELISFYITAITNYLNINTGRKYYQTACRYLRRVKKLGGNKEVNILIEELRKVFANRPALMDELNRV